MNKKWICGIIVVTLLLGTVGFTVLPAQAAPVQGNILFDDMVNGATLFDATLSTVDNIGFTTTAQKNVYDTTRAFKNDDATPELDEQTYLTYVSQEHPMTGFRLRAAFCKTASGTYADAFRLETSEDGETYTELELSEGFTIYGEKTWNNKFWGEGILQSDVLPANTHYLRIYFPPTKQLEGGTSKYTHIGSVAITVANPPVEALRARIAAAREFYTAFCGGTAPALYSYAKAKALSEALAAADAAAEGAAYESVCAAIDMLDSALQAFVDSIEGAATTYLDECDDLAATTIAKGGVNFKTPKDFTNLEDSTGKKGDSVFSADASFGGYFVYQVDETKTISNLILETAYNQNSQGTLLGDMIIKAAPAAESVEEAVFTELPYKKEFLGNITGVWNRYQFTAPAIPEGTKYIRIEFPDLGSDKAFILVRAVKWAESQDSGFTAGDYVISQKYTADGKAAVTVTYTGEQASQKVWLTAAEYGADGRLAKLSPMSAETCVKDTPVTLTASLDSPADGNQSKVFLWNGGTLIPLIPVVQ